MTQMLLRGLPARSLLPLLLLYACSDGSEPDVVTHLVLSRTQVAILAGGTVDVDAAPLDADEQVVQGTTVEWSSSDPAVASVSSLGLVTGIAQGAVFIRAMVGEVKDSVQVTVATVRFTSVAAGGLHTCALTDDGEAYCWGENFNGALGTGDTLSNPAPLAVRTPVRFSSLAVSERTSCGISTTGSAYCWGSNGSGQLGIGTADAQDHSEPLPVAGGLSFSQLSAGRSVTCGVADGGAGYCWGANDAGQLGNELQADSPAPSLITGGLTFSDLSVGGLHVCGLTPAGAAYCWGAADNGRLGIGPEPDGCVGSTGFCSRTPLAVSGGLIFSALSASQSHTCGITSSGDGYCWGQGGLLGEGTNGSWSTPVPISGSLTLATLTTGDSHTCAVATDGQAYCWGMDNAGQLGTGQITDASTVPVPVTGGLSWQALAAGTNHSCGLTTGSLLYCWGNGAGSLIPTVVPGQS